MTWRFVGLTFESEDSVTGLRAEKKTAALWQIEPFEIGLGSFFNFFFLSSTQNPGGPSGVPTFCGTNWGLIPLARNRSSRDRG